MSKREEEFDVAAKRVARTKRTADAQAQCEYDFTLGCEYGYQYAVEKVCEFIRLHIGVDIPVRLTPDGQPLAEDFFNKAEARANAAQNIVEQFKQFMEKGL